MNTAGERRIAVFVASVCVFSVACEDGSAEVVSASARIGPLSAEPGLGVEPGTTTVWRPDDDAGIEAPPADAAVQAPIEPVPRSTTTTTTTTSTTSTASVTTTTRITRTDSQTITTVTTTVTTTTTTTSTTSTTIVSNDDPDVAPVAALQAREFRCKLINGTDNDDPTPNALHTRFNMRGTDLGVPLAVGEDLFLFFGDTMGYQTIWPIGEADAVGRIPLDAVRADITALCRGLDVYVTPDNPSVAQVDDPTVLRDFAGAFILPPEGESPSRYIARAPPGLPNIPGALEVPAGALRSQNDVYVFYASGATFEPFAQQTLSFVARWDDRSRPGYQVLHAVDAFEGGGLGGHFIQIAPVAAGDTTYLFGTGVFRRSSVYLARTPNVEDPDATELYLPEEERWVEARTLSSEARSDVSPITELAGGVGELSAFYVADLDLYGLLYQRELRNADGWIVDNRVLVRFAHEPEGPWSEPVVIADMFEPAFRAQHCCGISCQDDEILHCDRAGLYGAYALPMTSYEDGTLSLPFLVSTWDPYNVVLFEAKLAVSAR